MHNLPVFILGLVCMVVYMGIGPRLFRPSGAVRLSLPKKVLSWLFAGILLRALWHSVLHSSTPACQVAAAVLAAASLTLFFWAYRQHGVQMPGRVFSPDVPEVLITTGPYARVRHPIYAAYLLYLLGLVIGTQDAVAALLWLLLAAMYHRAARQEDALLAVSAHAELCRRYQRQSGLLLPWNLHRPREV